MRTSATVTAALLLATAAGAQQSVRPSAPGVETTPAISDNSFLVEEGYNQEAGVVQHVGAFRRTRDGSYAFGFTQEWPFRSQRHQLGYTVPVVGGAGSTAGLSDVALNYRYQALGLDDAAVWLSPRVSLLFPTGSVAEGRGVGGAGMQVNLPLSVRVAPALVTHFNAGATLSRSRLAGGNAATTRNLNASASAIWLLAPTFNLMVEGAYDRIESTVPGGGRATENSFVLVPGARAAINLRSGVQIVPGVGIPIGAGPSRGERDAFLYLSVEHAFR